MCRPIELVKGSLNRRQKRSPGIVVPRPSYGGYYTRPNYNNGRSYYSSGSYSSPYYSSGRSYGTYRYSNGRIIEQAALVGAAAVGAGLIGAGLSGIQFGLIG